MKMSPRSQPRALLSQYGDPRPLPLHLSNSKGSAGLWGSTRWLPPCHPELNIQGKADVLPDEEHIPGCEWSSLGIPGFSPGPEIHGIERDWNLSEFHLCVYLRLLPLLGLVSGLLGY